MDKLELDRYLKTISERPIPKIPSNLGGSVLAKIRILKTTAIQEDWLDGLLSMLLRPQWAAAVLAVTLMVGGNFGRVLANSDNYGIRRPLGFEVFAADAPTLPSTILGKSRSK
jgi:hypothetical protein